MSQLAAVILTGSRDQHNILLEGTNLSSKTLLPILEKPMLQWVYDAIYKTDFGQTIYISTQDPVIEHYNFNGPAHFIKSADKAVASLLSALRQLPDTIEWVLFASGDHVLLTPEMIEHFVIEAQKQDLTLAVAVVKKSLVNENYPTSVRTYMPLKDDAYSGANLYLVHKPKFLANPQVLEAIDNNRKKPWKSIFMLDFLSIIRVFLRQVDMQELGQKASKIIGCKTACITLPWAEACMDVDKPSDKAIAEAILSKKLSPIKRLIVKPAKLAVNCSFISLASLSFCFN